MTTVPPGVEVLFTCHATVEVVVVGGGWAVGVSLVEGSSSGGVGLADDEAAGELMSGIVVVGAGATSIDAVVASSEGADIFKGEAGRSLTRASTAPTTCHVRAVVRVTTSNQTPRTANLRIRKFSQLTRLVVVKESSSFYQGGYDQVRRLLSPRMSRIVLIEDGIEIRRLVAEALSKEGHDVESADRTMAGLELIGKRSSDLVLMDLGLPDFDDSELLLRSRLGKSAQEPRFPPTKHGVGVKLTDPTK